MRVVRISHSSVVDEWRERDRQLRYLGADVRLVCAESWNEGGARVEFRAGSDGFAVSAATLGHHPNLFLFDPRPIWRILTSGDFDLLDIHEEPFSLVVAEVLLLAWIRRIRTPFLVYSAQNLDKHYPPPFSWIEKWVLGHASGAYACNIAAADRLRSRGFGGILKVVPLGVDIQQFHPVARAAPEGPLRVGYVGRIDQQKGVYILIEAIEGLDGWTLELVGDGAERPRLMDQVVRRGLETRIHFIGPNTQGELPERYRSYDVVVIPSLPTPKWTEQFCRVAVEAMASGVPIVASDAGALPEVIGTAGTLVAHGDPIALQAALRSLGSDPAYWSELRTRGLHRAQRFRWAAIAASQFELYQQTTR